MKKLKYVVIAIAVIIVLALGSTFWFYTHSLYAARNWGGSITIPVADGGQHISTAWKGNELWTETYFPAENKCVYKQESQYGLVEENVTIQPCNYRSSK